MDFLSANIDILSLMSKTKEKNPEQNRNCVITI